MSSTLLIQIINQLGLTSTPQASVLACQTILAGLDQTVLNVIPPSIITSILIDVKGAMNSPNALQDVPFILDMLHTVCINVGVLKINLNINITANQLIDVILGIVSIVLTLTVNDPTKLSSVLSTVITSGKLIEFIMPQNVASWFSCCHC